MSTHRYSAAVQPRTPSPDVHRVMDELAEHVLEHSDVEKAMQQLCRHGMEEKYGESLDGFNEFAERVRNLRRQLQEQHTFDPLLAQLSRDIHSLVQRELEALKAWRETEQQQINRTAESVLKESKDILKKLEGMRAGTQKATAQGFARLEKKFEKAFLQMHEFDAQSEALRREEARRLAALQQMPNTPSRALKKLDGYEPLDPTVNEMLLALKKAAEKIGAIERVQSQIGLSGENAVELDEAIGLTEQVLAMRRLESRLRKGALSPADESLVAAMLGSETIVSLRALTGLKQELLEAGYLEDSGEGLKLSPRAVRRIGSKALSGIFTDLGMDRRGGHSTGLKGAGEPDIADTKKHAFGDAFNINLGRTLMNAVTREPGRVPIRINPNDFEAYAETRTTDCANVLMVDLSYTMSQNNKLQAAKKVGFALNNLIRTRFPRDTLHIVGFATYARELSPEELPYVSLNLGNPFTNMQDGLSLAGTLVSRDRSKNRQIILITDGEPTAFCRDGDLFVDYPPTQEIFLETMKEVVRLTRKGITINTFMLDNQPALVEFVQQMTGINKGRAFFSTPQKLGEYLLVDYIARRKRLIN